MFKAVQAIKLLLAIGLALFACSAFAIDTLRLVTPVFGGGKSIEYKHDVLTRAMEVSEPKFGNYVIEVRRINMKPKRALALMQQADLINVAVIAVNQEWQEETLVVPVPIRGGTLSYRLLLIHEDDKEKFAKVTNQSDLKRLIAGLQNDWSTTDVMKEQAFRLATSHNFEGLFSMLTSNRVDYIPRAVYEAYDELNVRKTLSTDIIIEPSLALYIPMVSYVYVSPKEQQLAARLNYGLNLLNKTGELKKIFEKYYAEEFALANLQDRKVIEITPKDSAIEQHLSTNQIWLFHEKSLPEVAKQ